MAQTLNLIAGDLAWQPADAELEAVLDQVDVPTIGIFREGAGHYLFACLDGIAAPLSLWAYAEVMTTDVRGFVPKGVSFDEGVLNVFRRSPWLRFGVADETGHIIRMSDYVDMPSHGDSLLLAAASTVMADFDPESFGIEKEDLTSPAY